MLSNKAKNGQAKTWHKKDTFAKTALSFVREQLIITVVHLMTQLLLAELLLNNLNTYKHLNCLEIMAAIFFICRYSTKN